MEELEVQGIVTERPIPRESDKIFTGSGLYGGLIEKETDERMHHSYLPHQGLEVSIT